MNVFDFFFEHTSDLDKVFLVGKEEISFKDLYSSYADIAGWLENKAVTYRQIEATAPLSWLPPELYESKMGSMGKCIPGVELKVGNRNGDLIKPGETGEVITYGDNITMGYFAYEEGTKKAIRNGWLYTGELGTVDEE